MTTVLSLVEIDGEGLIESSREALTGARALAAELDVELHGAVITTADGPDLPDGLAAEAGRYGVDTVHAVGHELLVDYGPDGWASALGQLAEDVDAVAIVAGGTDRGNEVLATLAAGGDEPFVANCLSAAAGPTWTVTRVQWGGSLREDAELRAERPILSFAEHGLAAEALADGPEANVETFEPDLDESVSVTMVTERDVATGGVTLATAPVVVSGGRGVGSVDGFAPLEDLARLLDGVVGCSRAVTNNGWRPHADQVGQTGTRIAPELYIAAGISGAIQHWVGAMASKRILAINTDPEANMVTKADYAVIADLHQVVPAIVAEIERRRA